MIVKSPKKDATRMPPPKVSGPSSLKINKNLVPELDHSHVSNKYNTDVKQSQVMINEEPDGIILLSIQMAIVK